MEEQNQAQEQTQETYTDYIEAINKIKSSTVSKDDYEALKQERNELLNNLVNGQYVSAEHTEPEQVKPLSQLRKQLFKPEKTLTDVEYVTKALELRDRAIEETGKDCFVGSSHSYTPTSEDYATAQKVADVLKECVENSGGNNAMFMAELQSRMVDNYMPRRNK